MNVETIVLGKREVYTGQALTEREKQILHLVAYEYTTAMIAEKLILSPHTIITHRIRLMQKLGASNVAGMIRRGFEIGLLKV